MSGEEELAFLKAQLGGLSQAVLWQLKRDIVAEKKRREPEAAAKAKGRANDLLASPVGANPVLPGGDFGLPEGPTSHRVQA
jgi:hypothetical protein